MDELAGKLKRHQGATDNTDSGTRVVFFELDGFRSEFSREVAATSSVQFHVDSVLPVNKFAPLVLSAGRGSVWLHEGFSVGHVKRSVN